MNMVAFNRDNMVLQEFNHSISDDFFHKEKENGESLFILKHQTNDLSGYNT